MSGQVSPLWMYAAVLLVAAWLLARLWSWLGNRYEVTAVTAWRFRVGRRWYGIRRLVTCRECGDVYRVRDYSGDGTAVPWLLIANSDGDPDDVYWCPVTDVAPYAVADPHDTPASAS